MGGGGIDEMTDKERVFVLEPEHLHQRGRAKNELSTADRLCGLKLH